ncbi:Aldo/keto reductase [Hysterangium stoloniferum]|nr:Aldo/keto reductase [Hysterangium stoloniferum]
MSSTFDPAPPPPQYRVLSPNDGVHVSPLQLGALRIGDKWENFMDAANAYQDETSEIFIREWAEKHESRDQLIIATKYNMNYKRGDDSIAIKVNYIGNSNKSLRISPEGSLKKKPRIDILYVDWWIMNSSVEFMSNLHSLVVVGKVLYSHVLNSSNLRTHFTSNTGNFGARSEDLVLAPWGVVGRHHIMTNAEEERRRRTGERAVVVTGSPHRIPGNVLLTKSKFAERSKELFEIGAKHFTSVSIAYVMHVAPYVVPIIGRRKTECLEANIKALDLTVTSAHIKLLEDVIPFDLGFPYSLIIRGEGTTDSFIVNVASHSDRWQQVPAIAIPSH